MVAIERPKIPVSWRKTSISEVNNNFEKITDKKIIAPAVFIHWTLPQAQESVS